MSKFCQNCGNMLDDNAAFCDQCGKPFEAPEVKEPLSEAPQVEAPQTKAPIYEAPQSEEPQSEVPQYEAPQYEAPQYAAPTTAQYEAQQYTAPTTGQYDPATSGQYGETAVAVKVNPMQAFLQFVIAKKIFFIGGAVVIALIIALIAIFSSCASNSAEGALTKAFECAKNLDIRGAADVSYELNYGVDKNKDEEVKKAEEQLQQYASMLEMIKGMLKNAKLTVRSTKDVTGDELNSLKESWSSSYKDTDKISEVKQLEYEITGLMGSSNSGECYAVKIGGKWYVKDFSGASSGLGI